MSRYWIVAVVFATALLAPKAARASGTWEWPVGGGAALAYGARYAAADGSSHTHGGLDIAAGEKAAVSASVSGEVVFSGLVPAGEGARAWAVTVITADGLRVSYLPLGTVRVAKGQTVVAGQGLGTLAGSGDASSPAAHLHLGVKRNGASLDPAAFLRDSDGGVTPAGPAAPTGTGGTTHVRPSPVAPAVPAPRTGAGTVRIPAASAEPVAARSPEGAVDAALRAFAQVRPLVRVESIASSPRVDLARVRADLLAARGSVLSLVARLGLLLVGAACVWPVFRAARSAGSRAAVAPEPVRRR